MRIETEILLDFNDVLIRPKRSTLGSRKDVVITRSYTFKWSKQHWSGVPIMAANMDGVGTFDMLKSLAVKNMFTCLTKAYSVDDWRANAESIKYVSNSYAISIGITDKDFENLEEIIKTYPLIHFICIDVANGYSEHFGDFVQKVRLKYPDKTIIAGNVVTADMTQELILKGADVVKVGLGSGAVCKTRIQTGVGYPQLSAIIECADAAHGLGGLVISDGGCTCPGDVAKAFGAGADFVMLGSMLAGTDQGGGEIISQFCYANRVEETDKSTPDDRIFREIFEEQKFVQFYGMSSKTANEKHFGGLKDYRASEGRTVLVPYRGDVNNIVQNILGGLRSTMTYCGARRLKDLSKCTTFVRVNSQFNRNLENSTIGD